MIRLYKTDILYKFEKESRIKKSDKKAGSRNIDNSEFNVYTKNWKTKEIRKIILSIISFTSGGIVTFSKVGSSPKKDKFFNVLITRTKDKIIVSYNGKSGQVDDIVLRLYNDGADSLYAVKCLRNVNSFKMEDQYLKDRRKNTIMSFALAMKGANGYSGLVYTTGSENVLRFDGEKLYYFGSKLIARNEDEFIEWADENIKKFDFPLTAYGHKYGKKLSELNSRMKTLERFGIKFTLSAQIQTRKNASVEEQNKFLKQHAGAYNQRKFDNGKIEIDWSYFGDDGDRTYFNDHFCDLMTKDPKKFIQKDRFLFFYSSNGVGHFMRKIKKLESVGFLNKKFLFSYILKY